MVDVVAGGQDADAALLAAGGELVAADVLAARADEAARVEPLVGHQAYADLLSGMLDRPDYFFGYALLALQPYSLRTKAGTKVEALSFDKALRLHESTDQSVVLPEI